MAPQPLPTWRAAKSRDLSVTDIINAWSVPKNNSNTKQSISRRVCQLLTTQQRLRVAIMLKISSPLDIAGINFSKRIFLRKKNPVTCPKDLRPISIQNAFISIYEKALANKLRAHLVRRNLIPPGFHGYVKERSVHTAIGQVHQFCQENSGSLTVAVFLDFSAAFDRISIPFVLSALRSLWVSERIINRIEILLYTKRFFYDDDPEAKQFYPITGVPQGSPLSPILFLIATIVLFKPLYRKNRLVVYADDTTALFSGHRCKDVVLKIGAFFKSLLSLLPSSNLVLNPLKTQLLVFGGCPPTRKKLKRLAYAELSSIFVQSPIPSFQCRVKYLGFTISVNWAVGFDLNKFKRCLKRARWALKRAQRLSLSGTVQARLWCTWAISGLVFFSRGRPPDQRLKFQQLLMLRLPAIVRRYWALKEVKVPNWLRIRLSHWLNGERGI